jgi:hypothetical protein
VSAEVRVINTLFTAAATVTLVLGSSSAQARAGEPRAAVTNGWAGYVVRTAGGHFTEVAGTWVQPRVVCNRPGSSVAVWVGLGGASSDSQTLEQIGTSADCSQRSMVAYSAWYQLFPAPPEELPLAIRPGDAVAARVALDAGAVTVELRDVTTGASFSTDRPMRLPETDTAEWIVEAPSACFMTCTQLPLAEFGRVVFDQASTTAAAHTGTIKDPGWSRLRLKMRPHGGRSAAVATSLSANGSTFHVRRLR